MWLLWVLAQLYPPTLPPSPLGPPEPGQETGEADFGGQTPSGDESEEIRILLGAGAGNIGASGRGLQQTFAGGSPRAALSQNFQSRCRDSLLFEGGAVVSAPLLLWADGPLKVLGRSLRGRVEISCAGDRWTAINILPVETYLDAVLGSEMPPLFPAEALKAQAVAARSYALVRKIDASNQGKPFDLDATVLSQVYAGLAREDPRSSAAVAATRGEVLAVGMLPVEAYFHASCGGRTESGAAALNRPLGYLTPVDCPCPARSPWAHWRAEVKASELAQAVGYSQVADAQVVSRTSTGRAARVSVTSLKGGRRTLSASQLRASLGYQKVPSLWFDLHREGGRFVFEGRGSGHGTGLCQWGASVLATQGKTYREILSHYYTGAAIQKIY